MNGRKALNIVGLVGTGMVGASCAYALMQNGIANEYVRAGGHREDHHRATAGCLFTLTCCTLAGGKSPDGTQRKAEE